MAGNEIFNDDELQEPSGDGLIIEEGPTVLPRRMSRGCSSISGSMLTRGRRR